MHQPDIDGERPVLAREMLQIVARYSNIERLYQKIDKEKQLFTIFFCNRFHIYDLLRENGYIQTKAVL